MKPVNALILRRFGFRRVLLVNGALAIASLAAIGLFRADTPHLLIYAVLFLGGCLRSIQFTSLNSIAFADLAQDEMSRATSLSSAAQQVSLGLGVTLGATAVAASMAWHGGDTLIAADFPPAFLIVALVSGSTFLALIAAASNIAFLREASGSIGIVVISIAVISSVIEQRRKK